MKLYGFEIKLCDNVYPPSEDTIMLAEILLKEEYQKKIKNKIALEIGTGCGLLALICSKSARHVFASDISREAVECAKKNAERNKIKNISFVLCNLFSAFNSKLKPELIIFNPPYLPGFDNVNETRKEGENRGKNKKIDKNEISWYGGEKGIEITKNFLKDAKKHAKKEETGIIFLASSLSNLEELFFFMKKINLDFNIIARQRFFFEELIAIEGKF